MQGPRLRLHRRRNPLDRWPLRLAPLCLFLSCLSLIAAHYFKGCSAACIIRTDMGAAGARLGAPRCHAAADAPIQAHGRTTPAFLRTLRACMRLQAAFSRRGRVTPPLPAVRVLLSPPPPPPRARPRLGRGGAPRGTVPWFGKTPPAGATAKLKRPRSPQGLAGGRGVRRENGPRAPEPVLCCCRALARGLRCAWRRQLRFHCGSAAA